MRMWEEMAEKVRGEKKKVGEQTGTKHFFSG
eukprot:CAMPEP_0171298358 /NCGR_PEP_ID=MMETSP0816-20121228/7144_1 /TAXON_ID=420281 /ORGANISM="Proboscia inermis, Strain CCAP1064/1" /LENGTH=30 /DNA_ID= /DNA_START= /DNA_END= /DNA_ORIENTATION=